jgi:hypothetical protein
MSSSREAVNTAEAPPPRPFYNQAVVANGFVFCSGQLPKDSTGRIVSGTVQDRAVRYRANKPVTYMYSSKNTLPDSTLKPMHQKPESSAGISRIQPRENG